MSSGEKSEGRRPKILAAALGEDVHVAGIIKFLRLAEQVGYETIFLGPANTPEEIVAAIKETDPDIVGISYRLMPESGRYWIERFISAVKEAGLEDKRYVFGGTPPVAEVAKSFGFFDRVFSGRETMDEVVSYLKGGGEAGRGEEHYPQTTVERIAWKYPYPIIRQHLGLSSVEETVEAARKVAESKLIDVISIAPDQEFQENFFHPEKWDPGRAGAGGVPIRSEDDLIKIYEATRTGNYPLLRCYQGTSDLFKMADLLVRTIKNAWAAIPIFWFSRLDGRGPLDLVEAIDEHQRLMAWHGERNIPVELNEPHHFELRDAPDVIAVADAFLSAYNAKKAGVKHYIATLMFDLPPGISAEMDLAKQLAKIDIIKPLEDENFKIFIQTRTGLSSYPPDLDAAKGHMAYSVTMQMHLKPHIIHMVAYTEPDHAATAEEIIESGKIVHQVISDTLHGLPDVTKDPKILARREELVREAKITLDAIRKIADPDVEDPWTDPETLARALKVGILDAPHLKNNPYARGEIETRIINGAAYAVDPETKRPLPESERIQRILDDYFKGRLI